MLPAFIDAHGHFSSFANSQLQVSLDGAADFEEIGERVGGFIRDNHISAGEWVIAAGYDHNLLAEKRHPDRLFLDHTAGENPLVLQHQSGHCGVCNTAALERLSITAETEIPAGGVIGLDAEGELTGYLEETTYIQCIKKIPLAPAEALLAAFKKAMDQYFSYGITTVQEGMMVAHAVSAAA